MQPRHLLTMTMGLGTAVLLNGPNALASDSHAIVKVLEERRCEGCTLKDAELVQADLRDARLRGALLQRANLSGALLDGADLSGTDLSFTILAGSSLRNANLKGAVMIGTDLRGCDLTDAQLDAGSLNRSHWEEARGISTSLLSYSELHNAGIKAALAGRHPEAERWLSGAIKKMPDAAVSWVARGLSRIELGNLVAASQDLNYAGQLYTAMGDHFQASALEDASALLVAPEKPARRGNGAASQLTSGVIKALQTLGPIAAKAMLPTFF